MVWVIMVRSSGTSVNGSNDSRPLSRFTFPQSRMGKPLLTPYNPTGKFCYTLQWGDRGRTSQLSHHSPSFSSITNTSFATTLKSECALSVCVALVRVQVAYVAVVRVQVAPFASKSRSCRSRSRSRPRSSKRPVGRVADKSRMPMHRPAVPTFLEPKPANSVIQALLSVQAPTTLSVYQMLNSNLGAKPRSELCQSERLRNA